MSAIERTLSNLGISNLATEIYLKSLGLGALTVAEVAMITKKNYDEVSAALEELKRHDLVKEIKSVPPRYEMLPPYKLFVNQFSSFGDMLKEFNDKIKVSITQSLQEINKRTEEFETSVKGELTKTIEGLSGEIEKLFQELMKKVIEMASQALSSKTDEILKNITQTIAMNVQTLRESFEKFMTEAVEKQVSQVINSFNEGKMVLEELYNETIKHQGVELEPLWVIRGLNGLQAHIKDMLSRAKALVLIVTPKPELIPLEDILKLDNRVRVQVVSQFDTTNAEHVDIIRKLLGRDRTFVRNNKKIIVYGAIVDEKEAVFSTIPEELKEENIMGVATTSHEWVMASHDFLAYTWTTSEDIKQI